MFKGFAEGAEAFRQLEQDGAAPDVARLSDEAETLLSLQLAGGSSLGAARGPRYIKARGYEGGCLAILGFEGERADVARRRAQAARILRSRGRPLARARGPGGPGSAGATTAPYLRDALLDNCIMVETLETAAQWSEPDGPVRGGRRGDPQGARGAGDAAARDVPHLAPVPERRFALLHVLRGAGAGQRSWSSGGPPSRPPPTRSSPRAGRSPTITPSAATTPPGCHGRSASSASS